MAYKKIIMPAMPFQPKLRPAVERLRRTVEHDMPEIWVALEPEIRFLQLTAAEIDREGVEATPSPMLSTYSNTLGRVRRAVQLRQAQKAKEPEVKTRARDWLDDD